MATVAWHAVSVKESLSSLQTSVRGLSRARAASGLKKFGFNAIQPNPTRSRWQVLLRQFSSPLIYILFAATVISSYIGELLDAGIILGIVIINAVIGYIQEQKAEESLASITALLSPRARIIRDGTSKTIAANQLTIGDIVELSEGIQVPADLRIIQSFSLLIDEASLTGESIAVEKTTHVLPKETPLSGRSNLAFAGTNVSSGHGLGVVIAIGLTTEFGSMVETTSVLEDTTPLADELDRIGKAALWAVLGITLVLGAIGLIQQRDPISLLLTIIATAVSAVPEGLPVLITVTLAMGVQRLIKQRVAIRRLASLETLGQIDTIVSDKTGTLTENVLLVQRIFLPIGKPINISSSESQEPEKIAQLQRSLGSSNTKLLKQLVITGVLANNARLDQTQSGWELHGDPTEGALLTLAQKLSVSINDTRESSRRIAEVPFSSNLRFMATIHATAKPAVFSIAAKGNPSVILSRCTKIKQNDGSTIALTEKRRREILETLTEAGTQGYRILGLAIGQSTTAGTFSPKQIEHLTYLGSVAMLDAPRPTAILAVQSAIKDGIRVVMATGDAAATAKAVARQLGLIGNKEQVITESSLVEASTTELITTTKTHAVFAEISPKMKLQLVQALQHSGSMVAVTGDGANDAPILKGADIGIAMGKGSTDIARDVADMVLLDNNFSSIPLAIKEGRRVATTIQRVVWYILATNLSELLLLGITIAIGLPLPLLPTQILWINIITDGVAVSGLLFEPLHKEHGGIGSRILTASLTRRAVIIAASMGTLCAWLFFFTLQQSQSLELARSTTFIGLATLHLIVLLATRSLYLPIRSIPLRSNPMIVILAGVSILLTLIIVTVPAFQQAFHTTSLTINNWLTIGIAAIVLLGGIESQKELTRASTAVHKKAPRRA